MIPTPETSPGRRIAVVGTGISGLVSSWLLSAEHDVTVYESEERVGGHTHTHDVPGPGGSTVAVDTGFIVLNDRGYPNFERILDRLGVDTRDSHMAFSVADGEGEYEWASTSPNGLFARRAHLVDPSFLRMLREVPRFQRELREMIGLDGAAPPVGQFLEERGFSTDFAEKLIGPQLSAVWSADPAGIETFPSSFLAEFFENHGALQLRDRPQWRTVTGGSHRYVEAITRPFADRIRLSDPVVEIRRDAEGVEITSAASGVERYDHVIVAAHSDQALGMLADPTPAEREILGAIPYQPNETVLHTDTSLLPARKRAWASWNFHLASEAEAEAQTTVTYWMNRLQGLEDEREFCVTLNRTDQIDPDEIIATMDYSHPVFTEAGVKAQERWDEISGRGSRTHFAGAYWGWGFHEDGVDSALRACEPFGAGLT